MSGESQPHLGPIDPLIALSLRTRCRIRLVLRKREGETRDARTVEGVVLEVSTGRDLRSRLRVGIPTGAGEPVEVRVLLENVERVEPFVASESNAQMAAAVPNRPTLETPAPRNPTTQTRAIRRETMAFGSTPEAGVRLSRTDHPAGEPAASTPGEPKATARPTRR